MCDARILSQKGATVISRCAECRGLYIWHGNIVFNFTAEQFVCFRKVTRDINVDEQTLPFPDGLDRLVMRTPASDINLTFTCNEWRDFQQAMEESAHMLEVIKLIESS